VESVGEAGEICVECGLSSMDENGDFSLFCIVVFGHRSLKPELNTYLFDLRYDLPNGFT